MAKPTAHSSKSKVSSSKGNRSASKPAGKTASRSAKRSPARTRGGWSWGSLSAERKLDILGVFLALLGLLTLLALLSPSHGTLTGAWVELLGRAAGWGAFVLPLALLALGLWLVFRNVERLPLLSTTRLIGLVLVFVNLLTFLHLLAGGGRDLAETGRGGGYLGYLFERLLIGSIGLAGTVVVLVAWLLIGLAFSFDLSLTDLFGPLALKIRQVWRLRSTRKPAATVKQPDSPRLAEPGSQVSEELPPDFRPFAPRGGAAQVTPPRAAERRTPPVPQTVTVEPSPQAEDESAAAEGITPIPAPTGAGWALPSIELILDPAEPTFAVANQDAERKKIIEETLKALNAPAHVVDIKHGPNVTQFGVEPDFIESRGQRIRVKVSKIVSLIDDIALALAAPRIRIQAPVPGRNYLGIEVPNTEVVRVTLREVMESEEFRKINSPIKIAIGKDVSGKPVAYDLASMPHLLIAGTTGAGKSVCVNSLLCCLLMNNSPADLRLVLVDPKRVELTVYNGIPHLLGPVITDAERVVGALQWMMREMDSRYKKFNRAGVRNIQEYNARQADDHLPYLIVMVDELADLMMLAPEETERAITRLAQLARATGIHLILATQRPSVNVVTGLIKANFSARIAFMVASGVDSRVILDQPGAERLLGRGDMLFLAPDAPSPSRLQGVFVSDSETQRLVDYWRLAVAPVAAVSSAEGAPVDSLPAGIPLRQAPLWGPGSNDDPLLPDAIELAQTEGRPSITSLQRRFRIGYTRAARLIDVMEQKGLIGPIEGTPAKPPTNAPPKPEPPVDLVTADDPMLSDAIELIRKEGRASINLLQKRMRIGYGRAARIIDMLEQKGIIGPADPNSQTREVLDYGPPGPPKDA